jgi:hypothetical protein
MQCFGVIWQGRKQSLGKVQGLFDYWKHGFLSNARGDYGRDAMLMQGFLSKFRSRSEILTDVLAKYGQYAEADIYPISRT